MISVWNSVRPRSERVWSFADPFEYGGQPLAAADAHGFQPVAGVAPIQFARQGGQHPAAGRSDRVAQRDPRSVDIGPLPVGVGELPLARTASAWAANASLSSIRSISASDRPALASARSVAGTGPMPMMFGATPADPQDTIRTSGRSARVRRPARGGHDAHRRRVVLPAGVSGGDGGLRILLPRTGLSLASASTVVSARGCSSVSITSRPPGVTVTGTISSASTPLLCRHGSLVGRTASSSCSVRPMSYWRAGSPRSPACLRAPGSACRRR